jgi:anti-anti-sigma factor
MDLVVRHDSVGSVQVLHVRGDVDLPTLPTLADALTRAAATPTDAPTALAVDLDGVHVLDDAALGLFLGCAARLRKLGRDLVVVCTAPELRARLALTGFDRAVRVVDSLAGVDTTP